jgi:hypothetical protein
MLECTPTSRDPAADPRADVLQHPTTPPIQPMPASFNAIESAVVPFNAENGGGPPHWVFPHPGAHPPAVNAYPPLQRHNYGYDQRPYPASRGDYYGLPGENPGLLAQPQGEFSAWYGGTADSRQHPMDVRVYPEAQGLGWHGDSADPRLRQMDMRSHPVARGFQGSTPEPQQHSMNARGHQEARGLQGSATDLRQHQLGLRADPEARGSQGATDPFSDARGRPFSFYPVASPQDGLLADYHPTTHPSQNFPAMPKHSSKDGEGGSSGAL